MATTPYQNTERGERYVTEVFAGLNRHEKIERGEWADVENLTTAEYPVAMTRMSRQGVARWHDDTHDTDADVDESPRLSGYPVSDPTKYYISQFADIKTVQGEMFLLDDHGWLYREGGAWSAPLELGASTGQQMVAMGRDLVFQGGAVFRRPTEPTTLGEDIMTRVNNAHAKLTAPCIVQYCNMEGTTITIEATKPSTPADGDYYYDAEKCGLYRYSAAEDEWIAQPECMIKLSFILLGGEGTQDDEYQVEGDWESLFDNGQRNDCVSVRYPKPTSIPELFVWIAMSVALNGLLSDYIVEKAELIYDNSDHLTTADMYIRGLYIPNIAGQQAYRLSVERRMPVLDYICEHKNRIWGCRYGLNDRGEFVNEIYASAQGDPLNWFRFEGTAADSYMTSVGTGEAFTGCCSLDDYVLFFKEDRIYILSGSEPSNYRLKEIVAHGVQAGSHKSIVALNGAVYYKSLHGIYRMTAYNLPTLISDPLGQDVWHGAVAGHDGRRLYVYMVRDGNNAQEFYVYDTFTGLWMTEDCFSGLIPARRQIENKPVVAMLPWRGNMLVVTSWMNNVYYRVDFWYPRPGRTPVQIVFPRYVAGTVPAQWEQWSGVIEHEDEVKWHAETGLLGLYMTQNRSPRPDPKRVNAIRIRCKSDGPAQLRVFLQTDEDGVWTLIHSTERTKKGTFTIRHVPQKRCDTFRLRFEGKGQIVIYSIALDSESAGDSAPDYTG